MICSLLVACALAATPEISPSTASPDVAAYKDAKAKVGRDADAHVRLALWCEAHGMVAERTKHLTLATLIDPANATARGLLGMVQYQGKWLSPEAVAEKDRADPERQAKVREYLERRVKAADKPDDQMKLALWCDQNDLKDQATAHFYRAVQLDPGRELAWKHLGYRREKGRWVKPEQAAAEKAFYELQVKSNKHWKPILEKLRHGLASHGAAERARAEASLAEIKDPAAVPMAWATFAQRDAKQQEAAVKLFGQIDAPGSSQALAMLAIAGRSADVRRGAVEILKRRDPRDFVEVLIALIRKPIEYEVRKKAGLNTPGELFVKGADKNNRRIYTPMTTPSVDYQPGDVMTTDSNGLPVVSRPIAEVVIPLGQGVLSYGNSPGEQNSRIARVESGLRQGGLSPTQSHSLAESSVKNSSQNPLGIAFASGPGAVNPLYSVAFTSYMQIPVGQMIRDAQASSDMAQQMLDADVGQIESYNMPVRDMNRKVRGVLSDTVGVDLGENPAAWQTWFNDQAGFASVVVGQASQIPTTTEQVTVDYQPQAGLTTETTTALVVRRHSCFAAGTSVRTLDGPRPIEALKAGDRVLTQNTTTGRIGFSPVLTAYHNPPNETYRIGFDSPDKAVVATGIHRFWKVGEGWAMARDLKPGDSLRAIGGVAKVASIEPDAKQPVFNLRVAEGESFFVGDLGVLAHDNSLVQPSERPFDRLTSEVSAASRR